MPDWRRRSRATHAGTNRHGAHRRSTRRHRVIRNHPTGGEHAQSTQAGDDQRQSNGRYRCCSRQRDATRQCGCSWHRHSNTASARRDNNACCCNSDNNPSTCGKLNFRPGSCAFSSSRRNSRRRSICDSDIGNCFCPDRSGSHTHPFGHRTSLSRRAYHSENHASNDAECPSSGRNSGSDTNTAASGGHARPGRQARHQRACYAPRDGHHGKRVTRSRPGAWHRHIASAEHAT